MENTVKKSKKQKTKRIAKKKSIIPDSVSDVEPKTHIHHPILQDDLDKRIKYIYNRIYHVKDEQKKKDYENHLEKLKQRPIIGC